VREEESTIGESSYFFEREEKLAKRLRKRTPLLRIF
jgi:hypothetical protein